MRVVTTAQIYQFSGDLVTRDEGLRLADVVASRSIFSHSVE